jgi:hypothetical protein
MGIGKVAGTLGIGLVAGFVGTVAITASQMVEMRIRHRKPSDSPAKAVEKVFHLEPESEEAEKQLATVAHFGYGTAWGVFPAVMAGFGVRGVPSVIAHFAAIQGTAMVMLPGLKVAPPVKEWGAEEIAVEAVHHLVYAAAAGVTYEALTRWLFTEALPVEAAEEARGRVPVGAIAAALAAVALRGGTAKPHQPTFRVTMWQKLPEAFRERVGNLERRMEGV